MVVLVERWMVHGNEAVQVTARRRAAVIHEVLRKGHAATLLGLVGQVLVLSPRP
jgi:hypothetical protein